MRYRIFRKCALLISAMLPPLGAFATVSPPRQSVSELATQVLRVANRPLGLDAFPLSGRQAALIDRLTSPGSCLSFADRELKRGYYQRWLLLSGRVKEIRPPFEVHWSLARSALLRGVELAVSDTKLDRHRRILSRILRIIAVLYYKHDGRGGGPKQMARLARALRLCKDMAPKSANSWAWLSAVLGYEADWTGGAAARRKLASESRADAMEALKLRPHDSLAEGAMARADWALGNRRRSQQRGIEYLRHLKDGAAAEFSLFNFHRINFFTRINLAPLPKEQRARLKGHIAFYTPKGRIYFPRHFRLPAGPITWVGR